MNKVVLMGRLTKDPEQRFTSVNNTPVCSFTLAVNRRFSRQGEERQADFIPIVAWSKLAEFCGKYFQKGQQVGVIGRIQTRNWDDNEGKRHYATEVIAEEAYFADSKRDSGSNSGSNSGSYSGSPSGTGTPNKTQGDTDSNQNDGFYTLEDDELPF